jgi:hypothetical protein
VGNKNGVLAKVGGWVQFGLVTFVNLFGGNGIPHGWQSWVVMLASLGTAIATHAASNSPGN